LPAGEFGRESVHVFLAMIANRDLPTSMVAVVATSEDHAERMGDAWLKSADVNFHPGTPVPSSRTSREPPSRLAPKRPIASQPGAHAPTPSL
jgi:hypothetical protein